MNSSFRPLPRSMPIAARAEIMVRRGEAASFREACSMLAKRKRKPTPAAEPPSIPKNYRLPYADN